MTHKMTVVTDGTLVSGWGDISLDDACRVKDSLRDENLTGNNILLVDEERVTIIRHRKSDMIEYDTVIRIEQD